MASRGNTGGSRGQEHHRADEGTLGGVTSAVQEAASSVASTAQDAWDGTRRAATAMADTAGDAWGELTGLMRRYPFGTLFVGVGIGFVLSRLMEDRWSRDFRRLGSDLYDRVRDYAGDVASRLRT